MVRRSLGGEPDRSVLYLKLKALGEAYGTTRSVADAV
jgi:hypothetical protein